MKIFKHSTDKFGYYTVGKEKTYGKLHAIKLSAQTGHHVQWHFNDDVYSCLNWLEEPKESLTELYRQRAQQLRDQYDYLVLQFSGGADSTNILNTFVDNKIHLDEVLTWNYFGGNKSKTAHTDSEVNQVAFPAMKKLAETNPEIKFRTLDLSQSLIDFWMDPEKADRFFHHSNSIIMAEAGVRTNYFLEDKFYLDKIMQGKKVGFICGQDKPRVWQIDGKYCFRFLDYSGANSLNGVDSPVEYFYWSPDFPTIPVKQSHIIKRYLQHADSTTQFMTTESNGMACKLHNGQTLWLSNDGIHSLIYPGWDINTYTAGKSQSPILNDNIRWYHKDFHSESHSRYFSALTYWMSWVPGHWLNNPKDPSKGVVGSWSPAYYLES